MTAVLTPTDALRRDTMSLDDTTIKCVAYCHPRTTMLTVPKLQFRVHRLAGQVQ